jgi:protein-disulfide isomerase
VAISARPPVWRSPMVIVTVVAALVMVAIIAILVLTSGQTNGTPSGSLGLVRPPESNLATFADGENLGAADAPVVLEVFSDYQCPVCGKFGRDYVPRLVNEFVEPGTLRIVERSIAILDPEGGRESLDAAAGAACAARQDAHWQYHDYLMWNQIGENRGAFSRERLFGMAERVGLDRDTFAACLDDGAVRGEISDRTATALADGINSTPTFLVNGERFVGLLSYDDLSVAIEKHLAEASAGS